VNLAALACESLLYGMYFVLFISSMYLLVVRSLASRKSHYVSAGRAKSRSALRDSVFRSTVFIAAICLFCVVTAHWITTVYRAFLAFIYFRDGDAATEFYADISQVTELIHKGLLLLSILIGDCLIIHRLWVVWERRWPVVLFPIFMLVALALCSIITVFTVSLKDTATDFFSDPWLTTNCFITLVTNVYSTGFITYKIWNISAQPVGRIGASKLRDFLVIVVESAALYASWVIVYTATFRAGSLVQYAVIQCAPAVVGIVNALIHTRVGLGWALETRDSQRSVPSGATKATSLAFANGLGRTPALAGGTVTAETEAGETVTVETEAVIRHRHAGELEGRRFGEDEENNVGLGYGTESRMLAVQHCAGCVCGHGNIHCHDAILQEKLHSVVAEASV